MTNRARPSTPSLNTQLDILFFRGLVTCGICGTPIMARSDVNWDHVHAHALGGEDAIRNLRPVHPDCHKGKTKGDILNIAKTKGTRAEKFAVQKRPIDEPRPEKRAFGGRR